MNDKSYDLSKEGLANALAKLLGTTVVAQYMAHGYHWNVKGPEFTQFHDFFGSIYEDWSSDEDRMAEYIRILGFDAPHDLNQFLALACIDSKPCQGEPLEMAANLYEANLVLKSCVEDIFNIATAINAQGIADWAAGRMDAHSKWNWQIGTTIGADSMQIQTMNVGKSEAESLIEATDVLDAVVEIQPNQVEIYESLLAAGHLIPEEADLADALREIVEKYGKFNDDNTGVWAGYTPASENEDNAKIGVKCGNCVFYNAPNGCSIIVAEVEDGGLCRFAVLPDGSVVATAGSKPAPKKDQIKGSDKNKEGSASGSKKITFSKAVEESLRNKVKEHNGSVDSPSKKVSISKLKAVYRRGAGAFSTSHRPDQNRNSWAMARVNAFLHLLKSGSPKNPKYTTDNDLLPAAHPKSSVTASGLGTDSVYAESLLAVEIKSPESYANPEEAIYALTEFAGLGYEAMPIFRAAWKRGVTDGEDPFTRASDLAINLYDSKDADLLPKQEKE